MLLMMALIDSKTDQEKFEYLYKTYLRMMLYISNQILNDSGLAEDAVQEAYLSLAKHIDCVLDERSASAKYYLTTIVKNKSLDLLRKQKNGGDSLEEEELEQLPSTNKDPLSAYLVKEKIAKVAECLRKLDENSRIVLEYKYLHQLKEKEIAEVLGITPKACGVRIVRARAKLVKLLEKEGIDHA